MINRIKEILSKYNQKCYTINENGIGGIINVGLKKGVAMVEFECYPNSLCLVSGVDYKGRKIDCGCSIDDMSKYVDEFFKFNM